MMSDIFEDFTDELSLVRTTDDVTRVLRRTAFRLGFEFFCYLNLNGKRSFAVSNYPKVWQDRYFRREYEKIDPVLNMARTTGQLFSWSGSEPRTTRRRLDLQFYDEAGEVGIRSGISIPVSVGFGSYAILTFGSGNTNSSPRSVADPVRVAGATALLHAAMTFLKAEPTSKAVAKLTPRQQLCLKWSAEGEKVEAIAARLTLAEPSVRFHLKNARRCLGATNLQNATAIATALNLI